ncbi:TRAP transporter large permease [Cohaesibacter celericrescens]|uniref:TRAP transporter large permease protein n=1 Tax=Cohaesibacter celericrescens TaxID=2067669 RepID=A0A2N5XUU0_9HYPH|nr:TRAP transporter large permease [Cohaesibacter celericrescens]PLW78259.1 C4-dicarboxylate ABC transporter [Cohaesibacter celericrescens]
MTWLWIIPLMLLAFSLNMRLFLGIMTAVICYFTFFTSTPPEIAIQRFIAPALNTSLLAIPFFVMLGTLMAHSGVAERIIDVAVLLVGRVKGGLALTNILVSTMLGGLSASNLADSAMLTRMMVPEMEKHGYDRGFSAAVTAAGSLITPIIPPGIALIIYALIADVSVASMFMAGVLPGVLCAALLMVTAYLVAAKRGYMPKEAKRPTRREAGITVLRAWPAFFLVVVIIGGIRLGIFTPTEAGAVAVLMIILIGTLLHKTMNFSDILNSIYSAGKSTASVLLIIMASGALAWIFSVEKAGFAFADFITHLTDNKYLFLIALNLALLFFGMLIEGTALLIILVPLLKPTLMTMGIDPVHFGIILILNLSIGTLTPPVGTVMLVVSNLAKVDVMRFTREAVPFYIALFVALGLIIFIPEISLLLPNISK